MSALPMTCVLISLAMSGENMKHPGSAQMNLDGSWTVDWPMVEEVAAWPVRDIPPSEPMEGDVTGLSFPEGTSPKYEVLLARALVAARNAGKLYENPAPDNACPAE